MQHPFIPEWWHRRLATTLFNLRVRPGRENNLPGSRRGCQQRGSEETSSRPANPGMGHSFILKDQAVDRWGRKLTPRWGSEVGSKARLVDDWLG